MKTILISLLLLLGLSAFGQTAVRSLEGNATNLNTWTEVSFFRPNTTFTPLGTGFLLTVDGVPVVSFQPGGIATSSNFVAGGVITGNGSGLTNLAGATNFTESVVYNFNGKVTFNAVSYNTNLWAGPTNTLILSTNYQDYITTTDVNITNIGGQLARQNTWTTLTISNAAASSITARVTASGLRAQGSATTAALVIPSGKEAIYSFLSRDFKSTNYCNTVQQ